MLAPLLKVTKEVSNVYKRNLGIFAPLLQNASDPIQQLFLDKIREYKSKSKDGKLVDPSPELLKELQSSKEKVMTQFGCKDGEDAKKFPVFKFTDPPLETDALHKVFETEAPPKKM